MRNLLTASLLIVGLALGGCAGSVPGITPSTDIAGTIAQVQSATTTVCRFLPTAETVINIIATFTEVGAAAAPITAVADAICAAVTKKSARRGGARVRGVVIKGRFLG